MNLGKILILFIFPLFLQHCEAAPSTGVATNYLTVLIDFASHTVKSMVNNWEWILDRFSSNTNGTNNGTEFEPGFKVLITNGLWYANEETEIIDVKNPNFTCTTANYPLELSYAIGGMVGGKPMVCGGMKRDRRPTNQCFTFEKYGMWKTGNTFQLFVYLFQLFIFLLKSAVLHTHVGNTPIDARLIDAGRLMPTF